MNRRKQAERAYRERRRAEVMSHVAAMSPEDMELARASAAVLWDDGMVIELGEKVSADICALVACGRLKYVPVICHHGHVSGYDAVLVEAADAVER